MDQPDILMLGPMPLVMRSWRPSFACTSSGRLTTSRIPGEDRSRDQGHRYGRSRQDRRRSDGSIPNLEIVANFGVGYDSVDAAHAGTRGIIVTNTPDVLTEEVADTALGSC